MPRKTYLLGGITFTNKTAIKKHIQQLVAKYGVGQHLGDEDSTFVRDLLEWHPSASQKIDCGIHHFEIHIPKPWNTKGLLLVRTDGTSTDFSYNVCLNPNLANQRVEFKSAARRAIWPQVAEYKSNYFAGTEYAICELTGEQIHWDEAHVDHYPMPFADLLDKYVAKSGIDPDKVTFLDGDNQVSSQFADPRLEKDWADWHQLHARLRVIRSSENINLGRHTEWSKEYATTA